MKEVEGVKALSVGDQMSAVLHSRLKGYAQRVQLRASILDYKPIGMQNLVYTHLHRRSSIYSSCAAEPLGCMDISECRISISIC